MTWSVDNPATRHTFNTNRKEIIIFFIQEIFCEISVPLSSYHFHSPPSNTTELYYVEAPCHYHCTVLHTNWERQRPQPTNRKSDFPSFFQQFSQFLTQWSNLRVTILSFSAWTSRTSTPPWCSPSRRPWSTASPEPCALTSTSGNHSLSLSTRLLNEAPRPDQAEPNGLDKSLDFCLAENLMLNT